jgi:hypothetical protein
MAVMGAVLLLVFGIWSAEYEHEGPEDPVRFVPSLLALIVIWAGARVALLGEHPPAQSKLQKTQDLIRHRFDECLSSKSYAQSYRKI